MSRILRVSSYCCILLSAIVVAGCSDRPAAARSAAPAAPGMPAGWVVSSDFDVPSGQMDPIARRLGGEMSALRNTVYDVQGRRVQLNTIVAADAASADKILAALRTMKSDVGLLRKGLTIYEFVGTNDVLPDIRAGKAHLE